MQVLKVFIQNIRISNPMAEKVMLKIRPFIKDEVLYRNVTIVKYM